MDGETVKVVSGRLQATTGSAGLMTQLPGCMASVSNLAAATGGIRRGGFAESDAK